MVVPREVSNKRLHFSCVGPPTQNRRWRWESLQSKCVRISYRVEPARLRRERKWMDSLSDWVTLVASVGIVALAVFQLLLAAGLPYGAAAFRGAHAVLPTRLRLASAGSSALFFAAFYVVLARCGLFGVVGKSIFVSAATWILVTIFGLSALANIASPSRWERYLMAPIAVVLASCCAVLALIQ